MSLKELHQTHPWKTINKFMPYALKKGFTEAEVKQFFKNHVMKDKYKIDNSQFFMPIYGKTPGCYQFDTLIQSRKAAIPYFLIIININTRKAYSYPMMNKGKDEVLNALKKFVDSVDEVNTMTSDQDKAYINDNIIDFFNQHDIDYITTEDNNHNILGIINRFIRTLRDFNKERDFTEESMKACIDEYNNSKHSTTGIVPNSFSKADEEKYIKDMKELTDKIVSQKSFMLNKGDKVRYVIDKPTIGKKRSNLSQDCYIVDSMNGNGYNIMAKDSSVAYYPRHKLVLSKTGNVGESLNDGKRGIVDKIISYDPKTDKYEVIYEGGVKDKIKAKNLRETNPTHLSDLEIEYWSNQKNKVPESIMKYKGLK